MHAFGDGRGDLVEMDRIGSHRELWYHGAGCHAWLTVTRDTRSHVIASVAIARTRKAGAEA